MKSLMTKLQASLVLFSFYFLATYTSALENPVGGGNTESVEEAVGSFTSLLAAWIAIAAGGVGLLVFLLIGFKWMRGDRDGARDAFESWAGGVIAVSLGGAIVSGIYAAVG